MTDEPVPFVIDLRAVAGAVRRRALIVVLATIVGGLAATAVVLFATPRFDGRAMMLIRTSSSDPTSMVKDRLGALGELMPSNLGLGGGTEEELATELALLQSRAVVGAVVDSLRLEIIPRSPDRVPATAVVDSVRSVVRFKPVKLAHCRRREQTPTGDGLGQARRRDQDARPRGRDRRRRLASHAFARPAAAR